MENVYELIETLSQRTAMYTGECKLSNVRSFIDGYTFSIQREKELLRFQSNFPDFHDWVAKKYGFCESTFGWQNMILAKEIGLSPRNINWCEGLSKATEIQHKHSVERFFVLVQEYKRT